MSVHLSLQVLQRAKYCTLGVLEKIRMHPDRFRPLFCHVPSALTADLMEDIFSISLSPEGSNRRSAEEMVVTFWSDYLQDSEGNLNLYIWECYVQNEFNLQTFNLATGASVVSPIGFSPTPSVEFIHKEDDDFSSVPMFPIANTCVNCVKLPLHTAYNVFKEKIDLILL